VVRTQYAVVSAGYTFTKGPVPTGLELAKSPETPLYHWNVSPESGESIDNMTFDWLSEPYVVVVNVLGRQIFTVASALSLVRMAVAAEPLHTRQKNVVSALIGGVVSVAAV
jgi:hypothetical protein